MRGNIGGRQLAASVVLAAALAMGWGAAETRAEDGASTAQAFEDDPLVSPAQLPSEDEPVLIQANEIIYDEELGVVTASGDVELAQSGRVLKADTVSYNLRSEIATASGNVTLVEPSGEVVYAEYVELSKDLAEGFIRDVRLLMTDQTRIAAASGERTEGNRTTFQRAVFSPCKLCEEDPSKPPLWQIKANRVVHDQTENTITYEDAWMEIFGVPVLYTPYFEHPDPTVDRKSGFLAPTFGASGDLGATIQLPYFWALSPTSDLTIAPIVTTKEGPLLTGQYRERFRDGMVDISASATVNDRRERKASGVQVEENQFRGFVDAAARFDIDETWRWGADIERATDKTYLNFYNFDNPRSLTSNVFVEGLRGRNYAAVNAYSFQGLRAGDDNEESAIVLPMVDVNYISEPLEGGDIFSVDGNIMLLHRLDGRESRRASIAAAWERPFTGPIGDRYRISASLRGDGYWTDGVNPTNDAINPISGARESDFEGRIFPQLAFDWRYPLVRPGDNVHQVIEPMFQAVAAPAGKNPGAIPNEDSLDFEFDDSNLFSHNRFTGLDRIDSGSRLTYGLNYRIYSNDGSIGGEAFLGQSYRLVDDTLFSEDSGLSDDFSDYVGRLKLSLDDWFDAQWRFRYDKDDLKAERHDVRVSAGTRRFNVSVNYLFDAADTTAVATSGFADREEIVARVRTRIDEYWSAFASHRRDLEKNDTLSNKLGVAYQDECFLIEFAAQRNFFRNTESDPENIFFVRVVFKHLGEFATSN